MLNAVLNLFQLGLTPDVITSLGSFGLGAIISVAVLYMYYETNKNHAKAMQEIGDKHAMAITTLNDKFTTVLRESEEKHRQSNREITDRQYQFEVKMLDIISANISTQKELTRVVETFGSVQIMEKKIRELEERLVNK